MKKPSLIIVPLLITVLLSCGRVNIFDLPNKQTANGGITNGASVSFSGVTQTTVTINWGLATDDKTAQADLSYKLVRGTSAASINTVDEAESITGAGLVMDWTMNVSSCAASGLAANTSYYFAVLVRDADGNISIYGPQLVTTPGMLAPTPGTGISFSGITASSVTVTWGAATDNGTAQSGLSYKLIRSTTASAIDTTAEASAITGAGLVMDWTASALTYNAGSLADGTRYYFAVMVRDGNGSMAIYSPRSVTTLDTTSPTYGTGIYFSGITDSSVTVNWGVASDNVSAQNALSYKLVTASSAADIDTVSEAVAVAGVDLVMDWSVNTVSCTSGGLLGSTSYYYAVLVRDEAGNMTLYAPQMVTTLVDSTAPVVGAGITFSNITVSGADVDWGAATDNSTAQSALEYKLVMGSNPADIDTVAEADAITGVDLVMDWTVDAVTGSAGSLSDGTTYYFDVLVRDAEGNMAIYGPQPVTTIDGTAPTVGTAITFSAGHATGVTVSWGAATDNLSAQSALSYKLVKGISTSMLVSVTSANLITGSDLEMDWTTDVTSFAVDSLAEGTLYYFAVLVRDEAGNMSLYAYQSIKPMHLAKWAQWAADGAAASVFNGVKVDSDDNIYAAGYINGSNPFNFGNGISAQSPVVADNALLVKYNSSGDAQWASTVISSSSNSRFNAVAAYSNTYVYAAGRIDGNWPFDFGNGATATGTNTSGNGYNVLLVQYDTSTGKPNWAQTVEAGSEDSMFYSVTTDSSGNIYAAGYFYGTGSYFKFGNGIEAMGVAGSNNIIIVQYDPSGTAQWAKTVYSGPDTSLFTSVAVDSADNVYAAGAIRGGGSAYDFGNGKSATGLNGYDNILLVKYDSLGTTQWARTVVSGPDHSAFNSVAVDSGDNVYAGGSVNYVGTYTFDTGVTATATYSAGNCYVLVKYDTNGTALWAKTAPSTTTPYSAAVNSVVYDSYSNTIYTVARINNTVTYDFGNSVYAHGVFWDWNIVLVKYDLSGNALWAQSLISGTNYSAFNSISPDSTGNLYTAGMIQGTNPFNFGNGITATGTFSGTNAVVLMYK